jgi:hypothetical protein
VVLSGKPAQYFIVTMAGVLLVHGAENRIISKLNVYDNSNYITPSTVTENEIPKFHE